MKALSLEVLELFEVDSADSQEGARSSSNSPEFLLRDSPGDLCCWMFHAR